MVDQISRYRTVKLLLHVPPAGHTRCEWALHLERVERGIPTTQVVARGHCTLEGGAPGFPDIIGALAEAVSKMPPA